MEERDWQIIKTLYEQKNITKTARVLYMSQPTLTARIKQIEESLGTKLLYRGNKGITFTETGEYTVKFAEHILGEMQELRETITNMQEDVAGTLRIAAPSILARYFLPKLLGRFQDMYPKTKFDVQIAQSSDVISLASSLGIHFGFVRNDFDWREDERVLLTTNHVCAVAAQPFKLEDLPHMVRVDYDTDQYYQNLLDGWWHETFEDSPIIGTRVSNLDLCKEMVFNGLGYGILPSILIEEYPQLYSIPLVHKNGSKLERKTWLIYKKELLDLRLPKVFLEFVIDSDFDSFQRNP